MKYADLIHETTATTGTGPFTTTAITNARTFTQAFAINDQFPYRVSDATTGAWETGVGTLTAPNTISRSVRHSSNSDQLVNFAAGTKGIICTLTAAQISNFASATDATTNTITNPAAATILIEEGGITKRITMNDFLTALGTTAGGLNAAGALAGSNVVIISQDGGTSEVRTTLAALTAYIKAQP